jgi:hypothetical protein
MTTQQVSFNAGPLERNSAAISTPSRPNYEMPSIIRPQSMSQQDHFKEIMSNLVRIQEVRSSITEKGMEMYKAMDDKGPPSPKLASKSGVFGVKLPQDFGPYQSHGDSLQVVKGKINETVKNNPDLLTLQRLTTERNSVQNEFFSALNEIANKLSAMTIDTPTGRVLIGKSTSSDPFGLRNESTRMVAQTAEVLRSRTNQLLSQLSDALASEIAFLELNKDVLVQGMSAASDRMIEWNV